MHKFSFTSLLFSFCRLFWGEHPQLFTSKADNRSPDQYRPPLCVAEMFAVPPESFLRRPWEGTPGSGGGSRGPGGGSCGSRGGGEMLALTLTEQM